MCGYIYIYIYIIVGFNYYSFVSEEIGHACEKLTKLIHLGAKLCSVISKVNKDSCLEEPMKVLNYLIWIILDYLQTGSASK